MPDHIATRTNSRSQRFVFGLTALLAVTPAAFAATDPDVRHADGLTERNVQQAPFVHRHTPVDGTVTFDFSGGVLDNLGIWFLPHGHLGGEPRAEEDLYTTHAAFEIDVSSTLELEATGNRVDRIIPGELATCGAFRLDPPVGAERTVIANLTLRADAHGDLTVVSGFDHDEMHIPVFELPTVAFDFDAVSGELRLTGELAVADSWAREHNVPEAAGVVVGIMTADVETNTQPGRGTAANSCRVVPAADRTTASAPPPGPDVLIGDLQSVIRYTRIGDITAYAVGTNACNIGTERASWVWYTNKHPMIFEHLYRLDDRGFQQIGLSWLKHGFYAVSQGLCSPCLDPTDGSELGVGCSDPYSAPLNGEQRNMSGRSVLNPHTGYFAYTGYDYNYSTSIDRRMQVHDIDIDPDLNPEDARYFIEGQYITADDAAAGLDDNNASHREVLIEEPVDHLFNIVLKDYWPTQRGQPALRAWRNSDPSVVETDIRVPDEGLFLLAAKTIDLGDGSWRYLYTLHNLNSARSGRSFTVPLPEGTIVSDAGFHDVDYHSGEPFDGTDWAPAVDDESIAWSTDSYLTNPNANALRYGTAYSFSFTCDVEPVAGAVTIDLFTPGTPEVVSAASIIPRPAILDCNDNEILDLCDVSCSIPGCGPPCETSPDCNGNYIPDECDLDECPGDPHCADCNGNGVPDGCESGCETASAVDIDDLQTVNLNPGGGTGDPTQDALVTFTNRSGADGASVDVIETSDPVNPDNIDGFTTLGTTLIVDTSLIDGQFLIKIAVPFEEAELDGADPLNVDILSYDDAAGSWELAVAGNTQNSPGYGHPVGDHFADSGMVTPSLTELSDDLGDFGVFWNTSALSGFAWANIDHTTDFAAALQVAKNRYISMLVPRSVVAGAGRQTAIRVRLTSLHHPDEPLNAPDFGAWEGEYRWVNSLAEDHVCPSSPGPETTVRCAVLGCFPEYRDWASQLGGEVLHVTGAAVVPSSRYEVAHLDENCEGQEETCTDLSDEVFIFTTRFGNVDEDPQLNVLDVAEVVSHLKGLPGAPFKPCVHLRPNVPLALTENVTVLDAAVVVDALKDYAYSYPGQFGPCTDTCPGEAPCP